MSVEAAFGTTLQDAVSTGGTWTCITQYTDIIKNGISITRGAADELSDIQAGSCTLVLDNTDGRFTPENSTSPYYPNVTDGVPIRVSVSTATRNLALNPSFEGGSVEGWLWPAGVEATTVAAPVQHGTRAARVTWNAGISGYFETAVYGLTIGAVCTASVYVRVPAGHAAVRIRMGGVTSSASTVTDTYTRLTVTFTATASVMALQVIPSTTPAVGNLVYVDAVQVEEGGTATAFSPDAAQLHRRFWGLVNQWPVTWEGLGSAVTVTAMDVLSVLSRAEDQMRPMLLQEVLLWGPNAYYPLDEPDGSTSGGDASGLTGPQSLAVGQAGTGGALAFGAGIAPLGMSGAPLFTPVSATAGKYLRAELGRAFQATSFTQHLLIEAWFATTVAGRNILTVASPDRSSNLILYLQASTGYLTISTTTPDASATGIVVGSTNLADGALHHVIYDAEVKELYVDGVSIGSFSAILPVQDLSTLTIGASHNGLTLWSGSISNVALYLDTAMSAANLVDHYRCGTTGFAGETADERAYRLVTYIGLGFGDVGIFNTGIAEQAALGQTCLDHLRDVETTESGKLYAVRDAPMVMLQGRSVRYNQSSALNIVYVDFEPQDFELAYDTQKVANTLTLSRPGGATQRMVHALSRKTRGPMGRTIDTLCTDDLVVTDLGNWLLHRHATPQVELRGIRIEASTMGQAAYRTLMAADISTMITVTAMPSQAPAASMSVTVEGYREDIRHNQHTIQFHTSKAETDSVWVLGDSTYSRLGSTTRLAY
ncbi:LamG-like jellyroll fold domain-containing protein [Streptomyces sp. NPDC020792]|uniref:LamG-like jellyroll fold domain-containing protein n=1 Tax=Streptomyces sp. NPDC020792 TaxID=3365089 RepID=UPI003797F7D3